MKDILLPICSKSRSAKMLNVHTLSARQHTRVSHFVEVLVRDLWRNEQKIAAQGGYLVVDGASNQDRTDDPRFTRAVLYQLSYAGVQKRANNYTGKTSLIQARILKKPENTTNKALKIICVLLRCLLNTLMRGSVSASWVCCKR